MTGVHAVAVLALAVVVVSGRATTRIAAPIASPRSGIAAVTVEVIDQRPQRAESEALQAALRHALGHAAPRPGRLVVEVREYRARFIQGDVAALLTLGPVLGPALGARTPVWYGVCHLWAIYSAEDSTELGRWSVKGEKALPNTWGYRTAREALQGAFDEAIDRLVDLMALSVR